MSDEGMGVEGINIGDEVLILSGKCKGKKGYFMGWTEGSRRSTFERRAMVRTMAKHPNWGPITILLLPRNIEKP